MMKRTLRLGGYGDPAMLPEKVMDGIVSDYDNWLGYTHQWRRKFAEWSKKYCMASVDSIEEYRQAVDAGWRTFRVSYDGKTEKGEIVCPSTTHDVKCVDCNLCDGSRGEQDKRKNIVIVAHGHRSTKLMEV